MVIEESEGKRKLKVEREDVGREGKGGKGKLKYGY